MGLLSLGTPLTWEEASKYADHVREHGITQLLNIWNRYKARSGDKLLWGDEIEYIVVAFDDEEGDARLSLRQTEILAKLAHVCDDLPCGPKNAPVPIFHPEYGRFMLESTPGAPYNGSVNDLLGVESNMRFRRTLAKKHLNPNELPITITSFPRLGVPGVFTDPYFDPANAQASHSLFLPDEITNPHARFPTLTANIRKRRGSKVAINLPIYFDTNTPRPFIDPTIPKDRGIFPEDSEAQNGAALENHIYMDAMGFGMGCCCLQITFQACSIEEARRVYDALVPVSSIMLALTAGSPFWRGYIADVDCRWNVISGAVDDRTEEERGLKASSSSSNLFRIPKSRYSSVDNYISQDKINCPSYNDLNAPYDKDIAARLLENGMDELLSRHFAHLFIRDPLVIFSETIDQDDSVMSDHFENIQSTNWQTLRFKPPPPGSSMGWRVEFRSMEVQVTDFENAAFSIFIVLLSRAILTFGLNFYIPLSKVDENMERAQRRDAARKARFWFRTKIYPPGEERPRDPTNEVDLPTPPSERADGEDDLIVRPRHKGDCGGCQTHGVFLADERPSTPSADDYEELTMDEIINGKGTHFPGLLGVVNEYVRTLDVEYAKKIALRRYLNVIKRRADGSLLTAATWMRQFVASHPGYKHDSVITKQINYDLIKMVDSIEKGKVKAPGFLPEDYVGSIQDDGGCP
ncbi:probable gamma-glutamylcysteine synthetase [Serendipita indica DSM 11827]|uniref:Glutamate--cysteine ligase n=1 Tax=Serendipita indica (strain DSM 11827) TaxID=1109443 RepID=G4T517_SERID|nr:probable gamma-glutamylcysteine synthetase [Serendipita indica DSM 11827]